MGFVIGDSDAFSTWARCRTPIFNTYFGATGGNPGLHNLTASQGYVTQANTFFRCAQPWYIETYEVSPGTFETGWYGPFAFPGPPFPTSNQFWVGAINPDPFAPYKPNLLDDVEIQAYWVGRNVVIDATTYTMSYSALDGTGSFQTISLSASVISFDL
jgi:hypothetical protein